MMLGWCYFRAVTGFVLGSEFFQKLKSICAEVEVVRGAVRDSRKALSLVGNVSGPLALALLLCHGLRLC